VIAVQLNGGGSVRRAGFGAPLGRRERPRGRAEEIVERGAPTEAAQGRGRLLG